MLPKELNRFNEIPIKNPISYFTEVKQVFQKLMWNHKMAPDNNSSPEKEEQSWRNHAT